MNRQQYAIYERLLVVLLVALSVGAWVQARGLLAGAELTIYALFPLLGLLAFVLMWTHFVNPALRRLAGVTKGGTPDWYWHVSTGLVLFLLIAHPLLLNIGLVNDGLGLPPDSYRQAYGAKAGYLFMGSLALVVFLVFELHRWFAGARWWRFVDVL